jgi:hypothetical protein
MGLLPCGTRSSGTQVLPYNPPMETSNSSFQARQLPSCGPTVRQPQTWQQ